jgi:ribosome-associated translation inhibitor RaiA
MISGSFIHLVAQDVSKKQFEDAIRQKISEKLSLLENYISTIGNKSLSPDQCKDAINNACRMFAGDAIIQVSNVKTKSIIDKRVRDYFDDLYRLNYSKVEITFKPNSVGDIYFKEYGKLFLNGTIRQKFQARDDNGKIVYHDYTIKNIEIEVKEVKNRHQKLFEIIFHNITVIRTT